MWILLILIVGRVHSITTDLDWGGENISNETYELTSTNLSEDNFNQTNGSESSSTQRPTHTEVIAINDTIPVNGSFLAAILHKDNILIGAGAVVGERWIIATAFQMGAFGAVQLRVRVGSQSSLAGGHVVPVLRVFSHPMFRQFNNDVALLKTATGVLRPTVSALPVGISPPALGDPGELVTWNTSLEESYIQKIPADVVPVSECRAFYPDFELTESNICVVVDQALPFDVRLYGSPLVFNDSLVGLYMGLEANTVKPYLCSSLSPLVGWIRLTMSNETDAQRIFPLDD